MAKPTTDRELVKQIGVASLAQALGKDYEIIKKWLQRGIPWDSRGKVARIATSRRIKLPPNYHEERRV